jgi:hypothetical protein
LHRRLRRGLGCARRRSNERFRHRGLRGLLWRGRLRRG